MGWLSFSTADGFWQGRARTWFSLRASPLDFDHALVSIGQHRLSSFFFPLSSVLGGEVTRVCGGTNLEGPGNEYDWGAGREIPKTINKNIMLEKNAGDNSAGLGRDESLRF